MDHKQDLETFPLKGVHKCVSRAYFLVVTAILVNIKLIHTLQLSYDENLAKFSHGQWALFKEKQVWNNGDGGGFKGETVQHDKKY